LIIGNTCKLKRLKGENMIYSPLQAEDENIARAVVDSAYAVHSELGPGLLESIYEACFCYELGKRGFPYRRQAPVRIQYNGIIFDEGLRLDVVIAETVICELKAVENMHPVFTAQLLTYLKLTGKRLGFLINFNVPVIKHGIKRIIR
jgi:GxxExxY protein